MAWYSEDSQGGKQVQIDCPTKGYPEHIKVQPLYTHPVPVTGVTISPEDAEIILQDMKETALAWKANGHDILYVRFKGICERLEAALSQTKEGLDPATDPRD